MAETPEQIDPNEAIEAKLCAYLEGALAPAERAEIEEYLKNYPQHRQTLKDLAATREVLRNLPRATAPVEVAESFKGHLERSMLLDGPSNTDLIVRMNRMPTFALAAAIVVLATGLGIVVYIILPGPAQKYSVAPAAPTSQPAPTVMLTPVPQTIETTPQIASGEKNAKAEAPVEEKPADAATAALPNNEPAQIPPPQQTLAFSAKTSPLAEADNSKGSGLGTFDQAVSDRFANPGQMGTTNNAVRLIVRTDDPVAAGQQLRTYFATNGISYKIVGSGENSSAGRLRNNDDLSNGANQAVTSKTLSVPTSQPDVTAMGLPGNSDRQSMRKLDTITDAAGASAATQSVALSEVIPPAGEASKVTDEPLFVARAMTREQAANLSTVLSTQNVGQTTNFYFASDQRKDALGLSSVSHASPTTQVLLTTLPSTEPTANPGANGIAIGDRLTINVAQLVGPGVDKTNTVRVAENGTVSLPMIEPVPAAGQSMAELEKQIAAKYREANLIADATVTISPATTTQPAEATTMPTTKPMDADRVDVLVLVQKNSIAGTGGAATEPATLPTH